MRTLFLLSLTGGIGLLSNAAGAQEFKSTDQKVLPGAGRQQISVFIAGGPSFASGKMKDSLFAGGGWNINGGVSIPLLSTGRRGQTGAGFSAGVEAAVSYGRQKADGGKAAYTNAYRLQDGTIAPAFAGGTPYARILQISAGPKAEWILGRIGVSPSFLFGYFSLKRSAYTLSGTVANPKQPAQNKDIAFMTTTDYSVSGLILQPKIEAGYRLTDALSLFVAGTIAFGPTVENSFNFWKPQGNGVSGNTYSYDQFASGAAKATAFSSHWQSSSISMGLRYSWIKSSFDKGRGDKKSRLSMTPTTTRQTQGQTFGEKVAGGMQSGGSTANLVAGNPVPGVIVKGGKNPPANLITGVSGNDGEISLNGLTAGSYLFTLTLPEQSAGSIAVKGGKAAGTSFIRLTVNSKGQIGFDVLEDGDYKLIIEASDPNSPSLKETKKEKKVEKATSGLKDTLKTQV